MNIEANSPKVVDRLDKEVFQVSGLPKNPLNDLVKRGGCTFNIPGKYMGYAPNSECGQGGIPNVGEQVILWHDDKSVVDVSEIYSLLTGKSETAIYGFIPVDQVDGKNTFIFNMSDLKDGEVLTRVAEDGNKINLTLDELNPPDKSIKLPEIGLVNDVKGILKDIENNPFLYSCYGVLGLLGVGVGGKVLYEENKRMKMRNAKREAKQMEQDERDVRIFRLKKMVEEKSEEIGKYRSTDVGATVLDGVPYVSVPGKNTIMVNDCRGGVGHITREDGMSSSSLNPIFDGFHIVRSVKNVEEQREIHAKKELMKLIKSIESDPDLSKGEKENWINKIIGR